MSEARKIKLAASDPEEYRKLQLAVLERDGWRCQRCGSLQNLHVHHIKFRSHLGPDDLNNLISLCVDCHADIHGQATVAQLS